MQRIIIFLAFYLCTMSGLYSQSQTDDDTVWTKNIWPETVARAMFSQDGSKVFVSTNAFVRIYDTYTGDSIAAVKGVGSFIAYSPDRRHIYTTANYKLDAQTFEIFKKSDDPIIQNTSFNGDLTGDGRYLIKLDFKSGKQLLDSNIVIVDATTMKLVKVLTHPGGDMIGIAASPDGRFFVTASSDGAWDEKNRPQRLLLWDAHTFEKIRVLEERQVSDPDKPNFGTFTYFRFSPDSKMLGVIGGGKIEIFDMNTFQIIKTIYGEKDNSPTVLTFSPNSNYLIWGQGGFTHASTRIAKTSTWEINYIYPSPYWAGGAVAISEDSKFIFASNGYDFYMLNSKGDLTGIEDQNSTIFFINGQPNPSINELLINYKLPKSGYAKIYLADINGRGKINIYEGNAEQGFHNLKFPINNISSGAYFLTLELGDSLVNDKIIITK